MATMLSQQERRILIAARSTGSKEPGLIQFEWRQAAKSAGIRTDEVVDILKGLRRFGFVESVGARHAFLTESGARTADEMALLA